MIFFLVLGTTFTCISSNPLMLPKNNQQHQISCLNRLLDIFPTTKFIYTVNCNIKVNKPTIKLNLRVEEFTTFKLERSEMIIIDIDDNELDSVLQKISLMQNFNLRSYVIVITEKVDFLLFKAASKFYINKLLIIEKSSKFVQRIYKYTPYKFGNVNNPEINFLVWTSCSNGNITKKKIPNFNLPSRWKNTTITALSNFVAPYTLCTTCTENRGIEFETFDSIAQHLQLKINYTRDSFEWWGSKMNGTYSHILGMLQRREGDMTIGVFHSKFDEHLDFDMSFTYMEDGTHWLVPKATVLPYWKRLGLIFTKEVYLSIFFSIIVMTIICHLIYKTPYVANWVMLYQILLEHSLKQLPFTFRAIIIMWTCSCLILSTMFKSKLIDIMSKNSYQRQISSLNDIVNSKLEIFIDHDIARFYEYSANFAEKYIKNSYKFCPDPRLCINRTAFVQDCVTIDFQRSNEFFLPLYYIDSEGDVLLYLFKEYVFPVHFHLYFVKGYPVFDQIDQLLMRMRSNGIIAHFYDVAGYKARMAMSRKTIFKAEVLSLKQLQVAFFIWSIGILVALFSFMLEYIVAIAVVVRGRTLLGQI